jgi:hypothetical protein
MRRFVSAALVLVVSAGFVLAGTYTGTVTKIDTEGKKMTVKIKGEEKQFKMASDCEFIGPKGKALPEKAMAKLAEIAADKGLHAKVETKGEGTSEEVTRVTLMLRR